jgi:hypothetical protein
MSGRTYEGSQNFQINILIFNAFSTYIDFGFWCLLFHLSKISD